MSAIVTDIYRYPVKSLAGETLAETTLGPQGIPGDRCWGLRSVAHGNMAIGKKSPIPQGMQATFVAPVDLANEAGSSPVVSITLADGRSVRSDDPRANALLSAALGNDVCLQSQLPPESQEPGNPSPPTPWFDAFPLLILSRQALATLAAARPESKFDVRRFRPNIVVDTDGSGFRENLWVGHQARIGTAVVQVEMPCPRCVMTTHGFADLPSDPAVLRTIVDHNAGNLGIYATVRKPGSFRTGDQLEVLDAPTA